MGDPLFWLGLSLLLVAVSLTAVLVVAIPTLRELSRAARSAEKLFDTLGRELPPTLEALRLTGLEITELTDDVSDGVQHAGRVVQHVDAGLTSARQQAETLQTGTRSVLAGAKAAWRVWSQDQTPSKQRREKYRSQGLTRFRERAPQRPPSTFKASSPPAQNVSSKRSPSSPSPERAKEPYSEWPSPPLKKNQHPPTHRPADSELPHQQNSQHQQLSSQHPQKLDAPSHQPDPSPQTQDPAKPSEP